MKNGIVGRPSPAANNFFFHQRTNNNAAGNEHATVLLNNAQTNSSNATHHHPRLFLRSDSPTKFKYAHAAAKKNTADRTFLRSVIHATDSTFTGCSAKTAAASHAPDHSSRFSTRHSRMAPSACSSTFTM